MKYAVLSPETHANVPQHRERVFIVGFLDEEKCNRFEFPKPVPLTTSVSDMLDDEVEERYVYSSESSRIYETLAENVAKENVVYQYRRGIVRENKSGVCPTLTANMGTGGHNVPIVLHKGVIRKLTPRECFRLQGNDDIAFPPKLSNTHLYSQAGNSICVSLVKRIWNEITKL